MAQQFTPRAGAVAAPKKEEKVLTPGERAAVSGQERVKLEEERVYRKGVVSIRDLIAPAAMIDDKKPYPAASA